MLKKVPEIPRYDDNLEPSTPIDASFHGAGYHRAIVLATGASVDDIKHMKKRASTVPRKFLEDHNSFEINPKTSKGNGSKKRKRSGNSGELKKLKESAKQRDLEEILLQLQPNKNSSYSDVDLPLQVLIQEGETALTLEDDHVSSAQAAETGSYEEKTVKEEIVDDGKKSPTEKETEKSSDSEQEDKSSSEEGEVSSSEEGEDSSSEEEENQSSREQEKSATQMKSDEEEESQDGKKSEKSSSEEEGKRTSSDEKEKIPSAHNGEEKHCMEVSDEEKSPEEETREKSPNLDKRDTLAQEY